jgi:formylglycine-generating enzyme required for sulfatase activity
MGQYVRRHLGRLVAKGQRAYASTLYSLAYREQLRQGAAIPAGYDVASVHAAVAEQTAAKNYIIRQIGEQLWVSETRGLQEGLQVGSDFCRFTGYRDTLTVSQSPGEASELRLLPSASGVVITTLQGQDVTIDTGLEKWLISPVRKPGWADGIARKAEGLVAYRSFMGRRYEFPWSMKPNEFSWLRQEIKTSAAEGYWMPPDPNMPEYFTVRPANALEELAASLTVSLDHYGLYADLGVANTSQRFRWLEPGEFLMGSPDDEPDRFPDETLHHVTLTQGFWLADTVVTQAFWQAVMGDNPSRFKDNPDNPVEQVSWQDAQAFINKLNGLFPHLQAHLPSEAQWEYACRAGTTTAFSFGANITAEQVNYDGTRPYTDGVKGIYRKKTIPVKSLPPNPWGLYEMHGNVWEWCTDVWQDAMTAESVLDPLPTEGDADALRVAHGGSWGNDGRYVRSAIRGRNRPDYRISSIGFRLSLGPVEHRLGGKVVMQTKSTGKLL